MEVLDRKKKKLANGIEQFTNYEEDTENELMMLPTYIALAQDRSFIKYVELYVRDKERFFADFSAVLSKLIELGIVRDAQGNITNSNNERRGYVSAPKNSRKPGMPEKTSDDRMGENEAGLLKEMNERFRARS